MEVIKETNETRDCETNNESSFQCCNGIDIQIC